MRFLSCGGTAAGGASREASSAAVVGPVWPYTVHLGRFSSSIEVSFTGR